MATRDKLVQPMTGLKMHLSTDGKKTKCNLPIDKEHGWSTTPLVDREDVTCLRCQRYLDEVTTVEEAVAAQKQVTVAEVEEIVNQTYTGVIMTGGNGQETYNLHGLTENELLTIFFALKEYKETLLKAISMTPEQVGVPSNEDVIFNSGAIHTAASLEEDIRMKFGEELSIS